MREPLLGQIGPFCISAREAEVLRELADGRTEHEAADSYRW
jgi:DNA-binding CsgD family transcriptional regulator